MSVIVKTNEGKNYIFTKGADVVFEDKVINPDIKKLTDSYLLNFAKKGLRTLVMAYKELSDEELDQWMKEYSV